MGNTVLSKKLTRAELIDHLAEKFNLQKAQINLILETIFEDIKKALAEARSVELRNFGTFEIHKRVGRRARNPRTGEKVLTEPRNKVFFRPGQEMKKLVIADKGGDGLSDNSTTQS